jgi:hypothetical protein
MLFSSALPTPMISKIFLVESSFFNIRSSNIFNSSCFLFPRDIVALEAMGSGDMTCIGEFGAYTMGERELLPIKVMTPTSVSPK